MEMSKVMKCEVDDCAYNMDSCCHTIAITIGDSALPRCDTFCQSTIKGGDAGSMAGVGACKVSACMYNTNLECQSPEVDVGYNENEPNCLTFEMA
ncbi:MAG: DUF1540 domain-containing protein [Planctomycetes bacterium]|nr:DUF1540 domain-containing protein [Planctomycetota bacterium]